MIILNGRNLTIDKFPNNETLIRDFIPINGVMNEIKLKFESDEDFMTLFFIKNHIDMVRSMAINRLVIPYFPYSRMDRTEGINVFTLKYLCKFINSLNFDEVVIFEPHSNVSISLLDRVTVMSPINKLVNELKAEIKFNDKEDYLYFPDTTAEKRQGELLKPINSLTGLKHRDFVSGKITSLQIIGDTNKELKGKKVIMVDDLCSFGGTFQLGAEKLTELGISEIYLVVAHCEYNIFKGDLLKRDLIKKIYTTDSILNKKDTIENKLSIFTI